MTSVPPPRPRAGLGRVLDDLGATLLDLVHGDAERADEIGGVVIHDPVDVPVLPPQALVRERLTVSTSPDTHATLC